MKPFYSLQSSTRGLTSLEEAKFYIKIGLDKEDLEVKHISNEIGKEVDKQIVYKFFYIFSHI